MKANRIMQQCSERLTHLFAKRLFTLFSQFTGVSASAVFVENCNIIKEMDDTIKMHVCKQK